MFQRNLDPGACDARGNPVNKKTLQGEERDVHLALSRGSVFITDTRISRRTRGRERRMCVCGVRRGGGVHAMKHRWEFAEERRRQNHQDLEARSNAAHTLALRHICAAAFDACGDGARKCVCVRAHSETVCVCVCVRVYVFTCVFVCVRVGVGVMPNGGAGRTLNGGSPGRPGYPWAPARELEGRDRGGDGGDREHPRRVHGCQVLIKARGEDGRGHGGVSAASGCDGGTRRW